MSLSTSVISVIAVLLVGAVHASGVATAADLKLLSAAALESSMKELLSTFERTSGHKVTVSFANIGAIADRVQRGEAVDAAIANERQIDALVQQGKVVAGSPRKIAKVSMGVAVRKGAPKPDISSLDALKRSLIAARAIGHLDPATGSPTGAFVVGAFERLGWTADLKAKIRLAPTTGALFEALAKGDTDMAFVQANEIVEDARVDLVGATPGALASTTVFTIGVVTSSTEQQAAKALIAYLSTEAAMAMFKSKGVGLE